ncbi:MAG: cytochrome C, partial [Burkholderiaceae bacterium]
MLSKSKRIALLACVAGWVAFAAPGLAHAQEAKPLKLNTTADHTKFKELQREFSSGPELTKACLSCHTEAAGQIHRTKHWKWEYKNPETNQLLGKKHVINNFCISIASNEAACNSCHIGYGWKDASFDFKSEENVDC